MAKTNSIAQLSKYQDDIYNFRRMEMKDLPEIEIENVEPQTRIRDENALQCTKAFSMFLSTDTENKINSFESYKGKESHEEAFISSTQS